MAENENSKIKSQNTNDSESIKDTNNETKLNPMQSVQTKPLSTVLQYAEDKKKMNNVKDSGN